MGMRGWIDRALHLAFRHTKYNRLKCNVTMRRGELSWIFLHDFLHSLPRFCSLSLSFLAAGTNMRLPVLWTLFLEARNSRAAVEEERPKRDAFRFPRIISREAHSSRRFWSLRLRAWKEEEILERTQCPTGPRPLPSYNHACGWWFARLYRFYFCFFIFISSSLFLSYTILYLLIPHHFFSCKRELLSLSLSFTH